MGVFSERKKAIYKEATANYWEGRGDLTSSVPCQPKDVRIDHFNFTGDYVDAAAYAMLFAAYPSGPNGDISISGNDYCKVNFNRRIKESSRSACITFMHEYGHLLGRNHTNTISDVMYSGYARYSGTRASQLYWRHMKILLSKTTCSRLHR